ncbi:MAG: S8 family serine peptidase [Gammaproteobacteria bacterium]|nr:S8 family serine peptidase [Gammaproteobacteria bacterium]
MVAVVAGCIGLGAVWWLGVERNGATADEPDQQTPSGTAVEGEILATVVTEVAAYGGSDPDLPPVQAAPRRLANASAVAEAETSTLSPPEGFAFVEHHGEIRTHRFEPSQVEIDRAEDNSLDWLNAVDAVPRLVAQAEGASRDWSFGWIRLGPASRLVDVEDDLAALGVVVEGSAGALVRARLPGASSSLDAIGALPSVAGMGAQPLNAKLARFFAEHAKGQGASEVVPVFVTLMTDDPDGRWRGELERLGAVVGGYDADTRAYVANVAYGNLETVAAADYVQFVEPVGVARAALDTAVPGMGADVLRTYDGATGSFTGTAGAGVPIAVMDSGLNVNHPDIVSNRDSICGANFITPSRVEDQDLWADERGHGTHVTGTIVGNGAGAPHYAGVAPLVGDIRIAKVLNRFGFGPFTAINAGMDFLSESSECSDGGWSSNPVKPLVVNMSLSANALVYEGRDQSARKLDAVVWGHRQLYVVAQSNASIHGFSNYGAAKNSLAVGAVLDSGELASFSSHGPTADGRLAPQVVGTGVSVFSASGGGSPGSYRRLSGTSMASPAVAGVATLLMEAVPGHQEEPALARARLMASAIKPDAWLKDPGAFPTDNSGGPGAMNARFGLGKVSAPTSVLTRDQDDGWSSGSFTAAFADGEYAYHDIVVPQGASRLDVVLTWDEPPTDVVASTVLNDLDLWLDQGGDCTVEPCGEHSSQSRRDNVEWLIVQDPTPGTWRAKVAATRVYTEAPRAALAWTVIRGPSTPELAISVDNSPLNTDGEVALTVTANGYVAAGVRLHVECRTLASQAGDQPGEIVPCNASGNYLVANADGVDRPAGSLDPGWFLSLGDIAAGASRVVRFDYPSGDAAALHFTATSWNATAASISVPMSAATPDDVAAVDVPGNDSFAGAEVLTDAEGSRQVDMLHASTEPGEADYTRGAGRPAGSVWYRWKATTAGPVHFGAVLDDDFALRAIHDLDRWAMRIDVYVGDSLAGVRKVASSPWGASFFALPDTDYVVRIATGDRVGPATVYWQRGERPENDRFDAATAISGEQGSEVGTNLGATLDPGEYHGGLGATVWYSWTAPDDGAWKFRSGTGQLKVLAFSGGAVSEVRLVSGYPDSSAEFLAQSGETYRIAIAAEDAFAGGSRFDLSWSSVERSAGSDDLAGATQLPAEEAASWSAYVDSGATVEPGEPLATGVRTRWWSWTAPATGEFTWRLTDSAGMTLTGFSGDSLDTLELVGSARATGIEFSFGAEEDETYRFAVGLANRHGSVFTRSYVHGTVVFGPTPSNDAWSDATALAAASGTVTGSNLYATTEPYERTWDVGHSSVWWTFEAPADGWYRFWVDETNLPFTLSAYVHGSGSAGQLDMIVASRRGAGRVEIAIQVDAGERYGIRLGTFGNAQGADFTMHWEETDAPNLLRYVGQFTPKRGEDELDRLGRMAFDSTGKALYVVSPHGLSVLGRDPETGILTDSQLLSGDQASAALLWDRDNARLLVFKDCEARAYEAVDGTYRRLRDASTLSGTGTSPCINGRVFTDPARTFVYGVSGHQGIKVYAVESGDTLRHVQTFELSSVRDAVIANAGGHVFAVEDHVLHVLERDGETGEIAETGRASLADQVFSLAVSHDDVQVFTFGRIPAFVHDLQDPADPRLVGYLTPPTQFPLNLNCSLSIARNDRSAADAFCVDSAYAVQWESSTNAFQLADFVSSWQTNRYRKLLPDFDWPGGVAASPEGRHAYVSTEHHGILIFERVGNPLVEVELPGEGGYVRLAALKVSAGRVDLGTLSSANCIDIQDLTVDGILYDVDASKWQRRTDANGTWADIAGTDQSGKICSYTPTATGQYRLAVDMEIDTEAGKYASNVLDYEAE